LDQPGVRKGRVDRAVALVHDDHCQRLSTLGLFLVRSASRANRTHTVDAYGCSCEDFQKRGGMCMHRIARSLFLLAERAEAEQGLDVDAAIDLELTPLAYELLATLGESCDLPHQCSRCGQEPALASHRDHLGAACISAELFGDDDAA
jgi:hypothetical protein